MKLVLALLLMLFPLIAGADTLMASCTRPAKYTDGSTLEANTVVAYKFYGALKGQPKPLLTPTAVSACAYAWTLSAPGNYCLEATAIAQGQESDHTGEVCKVVAPPKPEPPTNLVTTSTVAYTIVTGRDRLVALIVGTVPLGTVCDPRQKALDFHVIPVASVKFTGALKTDTAVAYCGG